jgi:hypothetical protein
MRARPAARREHGVRGSASEREDAPPLEARARLEQQQLEQQLQQQPPVKDEAASLLGVSALAFVDARTWPGGGGAQHVLLVGSGGQVAAWDYAAGRELGRQRVLCGSTVHGLSARGALVLVFGERRAKLCSCAWTAQGGVELGLAHDFGHLLDLVWDARWLSEEALALGFAQGFVQLWRREGGGSWSLERQSLCGARCVLYSLTFAPEQQPRRGGVWAAGGTAFGEIALWDGAEASGAVAQMLRGHRGPVFALAWSADARELCSCGDDRTVRLWSAVSGESAVPHFEAMWCSFGHTARPWSAALLGATGRAPASVATVGEDNMLRFWDRASGRALAAVDAHFGRNTWRVAAAPDGLVVVTGGGDSSVKLWDAERELAPRCGVGSAFCCGAPAAGGAAPSGAVCAVVELPGTSSQLPPRLLVVTSKWELLTVSELAQVEPLWGRVAMPGAAAAPGFAKPAALAASLCGGGGGDDPGAVCAAVGGGDGSLALWLLDGASPGEATLVLRRMLSLAGVAVNFVHAERTSEGVLVVAAVADGSVHVLRLARSVAGPRGWLVRSGELEPSRVRARRLSSAVLVSDRFVVLGDSFGHVHFGEPALCSDPDPGEADSSGASSRRARCIGLRTLANLHGETDVACLVVHDGHVFSGGSNAAVMELAPQLSGEGGELALQGLRVLRCIRTTGLMTHVQFLRWSAAGHLLIGGCEFNDFVVWDETERSLLLREARGGWKSPAALLLDRERPLGLCALFFTLKGGEIKQAPPLTLRRLGHLGPARAPLFRRATLGMSFHSRAVWTTRWLPAPLDDYLFSGCEDGCMKLTRVCLRGLRAARARRQLSDVEAEQALIEQSLPACDGDALQIEASVLVYGTIRASCFSALAAPFKGAVLVTGGAERILRCWMVAPSSDNSRRLSFALLCEEVPRDADARNERINAVWAYCVEQPELRGQLGRHRVLVGHSRGAVDVYELAPGLSECRGAKMDPRFECPAALTLRFSIGGGGASGGASGGDDDASPVRSLDCWRAQGRLLLVTGRNNGMVELWQVADDRPVLCAALRLHGSGVNCISIGAGATGPLLVASGGDDQALGIVQLDRDTWTPLRAVVLGNAAASAQRGVATDGARIWACGLDQRLRVWQVDFFGGGNDTKTTSNICPCSSAASCSRSCSCSCSCSCSAPLPVERLWLQAGLDTTRSAESGLSLRLEHDQVVDVADMHALHVRARDASVALSGLGLQVRASCS